MRILIADDHGIVRGGLKLLIDRQPDMEVVAEAEDGVEAVDYLHRRGKFHDAPRPDLILLDINMPGGTGFEVLNWIREQPSVVRPRVIVLTTAENLREVNEAYRLGAASFLMKPIDADDFRNTVLAFQEALRTAADEGRPRPAGVHHAQVNGAGAGRNGAPNNDGRLRGRRRAGRRRGHRFQRRGAHAGARPALQLPPRRFDGDDPPRCRLIRSHRSTPV